MLKQDPADISYQQSLWDFYNLSTAMCYETCHVKRMSFLYHIQTILYNLSVQLNETPTPQMAPYQTASLPDVGMSQPIIPRSELSKYNGKNGFPAYVAVNNVVYDVTDHAAWAAASHFGLFAGRDLTQEYNSCHAGQTFLAQLKVVGTLA